MKQAVKDGQVLIGRVGPGGITGEMGQTEKQLNLKTEMKQEVDTMLTEMKLLAEDIKGSMVDTEL